MKISDNYYTKTITIAILTPCKVFLKCENHTGYVKLSAQFYNKGICHEDNHLSLRRKCIYESLVGRYLKYKYVDCFSSDNVSLFLLLFH